MDIRDIFRKKNQDEYYYCIADAHGLHTFIPYKRYEKDAEIFEQIVEDNRVRHAISFGLVLNTRSPEEPPKVGTTSLTVNFLATGASPLA